MYSCISMACWGSGAAFFLGYSVGITSWIMMGRQMIVAAPHSRNRNGGSVLLEAACPACTPPTPKNSSFDQVVTQVYELSLGTTKTVRNYFDIKSWDKNTDGGLMDEDRLLLAKYYSSSNSVFECGLGESTYIASHVGVPRYAGIDSDAVWVNVARSKSLDHFRFYYGDIGDTAAWGQPANPSLVKIILDYQLAPLIVEPHPFDVYTVDGRYRVACMMLAFLHASARGAQKDATIVLLHDCYHKERSGSNYNETYHRVIYDKASHLLELVDHSGYRLCVYKRKSDTTDEQLLEIWKSSFRENNW